jgi:hypothetical protein
MSDTKQAVRPKASADEPAAPSPAPAAAPDVASPPVPPPPAEPVRLVRPLPQARIILSQAADGAIGNIWVATVPDGTLPSDVLDPVFFAGRASDMKAGDLIHVLHDGWQFEVELRVRLSYVVGYGTTPNRVKVYKRSFMDASRLTASSIPRTSTSSTWGRTSSGA